MPFVKYERVLPFLRRRLARRGLDSEKVVAEQGIFNAFLLARGHHNVEGYKANQGRRLYPFDHFKPVRNNKTLEEFAELAFGVNGRKFADKIRQTSAPYLLGVGSGYEFIHSPQSHAAWMFGEAASRTHDYASHRSPQTGLYESVPVAFKPGPADVAEVRRLAELAEPKTRRGLHVVEKDKVTVRQP